MEEEQTYRILAESVGDFKWIESEYKKFRKYFKISPDVPLLIKKGFSFEEGRKKINISPLVDTRRIEEVEKYTSSSELNLLKSTSEQWYISGKECDYTVHSKRLESLL